MAVNLLLSFAFHGPRGYDIDLARVRADLTCGNLMIDSGAFTAFSKGVRIRLEEYAEWLERWRGAWQYAMNLDVIGNPEASARQCARLHARGLPVMPVFTAGARLAEFDAMVRDSRYVAVGGLAGRRISKDGLAARVGMLQRRAADQGGGIHALGIGALSVLRRARPYSADSSACSAAFLYGSLVYFDGREVRQTATSNRAALARHRDHITAQDIPLAEVLRLGKLPGKSHRPQMVRGYSLTYAVADEHLKRAAPVAAPDGLPPGPQLYNSVTPDWMVYPTARLDRELHDGTWRPRAWQRYGGRHACPGAVAA